jgi:hypothetical protein
MERLELTANLVLGGNDKAAVNAALKELLKGMIPPKNWTPISGW